MVQAADRGSEATVAYGEGDGTVNGTCVFTASACVNVTDPRLVDRAGTPLCTATNVATVTMAIPLPNDVDPDEAAVATALCDLFAGLAPSSGSGTADEVVTYNTAITAADLCSAPTTVSVPLNGKKSRRIALKVQTRTTPPAGKTTGVLDTDRVTLKCLKAP